MMRTHHVQQWNAVASLFALCLVGASLAFSPSQNWQSRTYFPSLSSSTSPTAAMFVDTERPIDMLQEWAVSYCGVQYESGFCLVPQEDDFINQQRDQWLAASSSGGSEGSRVLYVPGGLAFSAAQCVADLEARFPNCVEDVHKILREVSAPPQLFSQFALMVRLVEEYERGENSPWFPWFRGLPQTWTTAASMDEFCLSCLPPFLKSLATQEQEQMLAFGKAIAKVLPDSRIAHDSGTNPAALQFLYNVVRTRSFVVYSERMQNYDIQIIPVADMINHGDPPNSAIYSDGDGACHVVLTKDIAPGTPLSVTYDTGGSLDENDGLATNPSRCFAIYGFLHPAQTPPVATYSKFLIPNPSREIIDIGYEPSKMLFFTHDGSIAPPVWDVVLYSRLERKPELRSQAQQFYQAHIQGDEDTKAAIHNQHIQTTCKALQRHVNGILAEVAQLRVQTNAYDSSKHPRLPLIIRHNDLVWETFCKTRDYLQQLSQQI